jgi:hypothetical protein
MSPKLKSKLSKTKVERAVKAKVSEGAPAHLEKVLHDDIQKRVCERSYEFFIERGYEHGHHEEDWLRAEAEVLAELEKRAELNK